MDSTWQNPNITGVFIKIPWNDVHVGPDEFDWTAMDREIAKAVQHGKLYILAFKAGELGTPKWIFDLQPPDASVVKRLYFQDGGAHLKEEKCGSLMVLGSPATRTTANTTLRCSRRSRNISELRVPGIVL